MHIFPQLRKLEDDTASALAFSGKVRADQGSGRPFISDSNHIRILGTTFDVEVQLSIGGGEAGMQDGDLAGARFDHPQGVAVDGEVLYVADTNNHAIRVADLETRMVSTLEIVGCP